MTSFYLSMSCFCYILKQIIIIIIKKNKRLNLKKTKRCPAWKENRKAHTSLPSLPPLGYVPFSELFLLFYFMCHIRLREQPASLGEGLWQLPLAGSKVLLYVRGVSLVLMSNSLLHRKAQAGEHLACRRLHTCQPGDSAGSVGLASMYTVLSMDRRKWANDCEMGWGMWLSVCLVCNRPRILPPALQKKKEKREEMDVTSKGWI